MNYDQEITKLAEVIKADKGIIQPWRNKAVARLEEVQAFVRMGKNSTNKYWSMEGAMEKIEKQLCSCLLGARDIACGIHGGQN